MNRCTQWRVRLAASVLMLTASVAAAQTRGGAAPAGDAADVNVTFPKGDPRIGPMMPARPGAPDGPGYSADFENPPYVGSPGGTLLSGQNLWVLPAVANSTDFFVWTYAGNTLGIPANPTGGLQFAAVQGPGGAVSGRAQNDTMPFGPQIWDIAWDMCARFNGALPATNNIGSFSLQPSGTAKSFIALLQWADLNTAATWNFVMQWNPPTGAAVQEIPAPGMGGLSPNRWYRGRVKVNFANNQILEVALTDLTTSVTVTANPTNRWLVDGQFNTRPIPNGIRLFASGSVAGNVAAYDNIDIDEAPAVGACCNDAIGDCQNNVNQVNCNAPLRFSQGLACNQISPLCGETVGACCLPGGACQNLTGNVCSTQGGRWFSGDCGTFNCPPDNDRCETAAVVTDGAHAFSNEFAQDDGQLNPTCVAAPNVVRADVWYTYTAGCTGFVTISTCPTTDFDSVLVVHDTDDCNAIRQGQNEIACSDDDCGTTGGPSEVRDLFVVQGSKYTIRVAGWNGETGSGTLLIKCRDPGMGACCHVDGTCTENVSSANCPAPSRFLDGRTCQTSTTCPPAGACCLGVQGCQVMFQDDCAAQAGTFLGVNSRCASSPPGNQDCDANGISNQCEIAQRLQFDCQPNGIPDNCDVNPALGGTSRDCQPDGTPDECQLTGGTTLENGPLVTTPTGTCLPLGGLASEVQTGNTIAGYGMQGPANNRVADDFTLNQGARIDRVRLFAYQTNAGTTVSTFTSVTLRIWDGPPGAPGSNVVFGDTTTNRLLSSTFTNIYRYFNATCATTRPVFVQDVNVGVTLPAGTYWLDFNHFGDAGLAGPWAPNVTCTGFRGPTAGCGNPPGNAMQSVGGGAWAALVDGTEPQDLPYEVLSSAPGDCNCNEVPDDCDISGGTSQDVNQNGTPDECERGLPTSAVGACCLPGGECTDTILACCNDLGGSFRGVGTACATTQCPSGCATTPGDMDGDGDVDGADLQRFVACILAGPVIGPGCECADMDGSGTLTIADVPLMAAALTP